MFLAHTRETESARRLAEEPVSTMRGSGGMVRGNPGQGVKSVKVVFRGREVGTVP